MKKIDLLNQWKTASGCEASVEDIMAKAQASILDAESSSSDELVQVGAVLMTPTLDVISASNSTVCPRMYPPGFWRKHDTDEHISKSGLRKSDVVIHAEQRLIVEAIAQYGKYVPWSSFLMVTSAFPCAHCMSSIIEFTGIQFLLTMDKAIASPIKQEKAKELLSWHNRTEASISVA